jgi:hypothetical protein
MRGSVVRTALRPLVLQLALVTALPFAQSQTLDAPEITYALVSGAGGSTHDPRVWVQGAAALGVGSSGLPLQPAPVVPPQASWAALADARWIGPAPSGAARPGGYEYFTLFALPPGFRSASLDILWRADDGSEIALNGTRLPVRGGHFSPSRPVAEFHGEIGHLLAPGMNRLQFFVANAGTANNPSGLLFTARITLSRSLPEPTLRVTVSGLGAGAFHPDRTRVWHYYRDNPVLRPEGDGELVAGEGNLTAPDLFETGGLWQMRYVGQGRDGRARIFGAASTDGIFWQRLQEGRPLLIGERASPVAHDEGDPSVVRVGGREELFYSRALGDRSQIERFAPDTSSLQVLSPGPPDTWDGFRVSRPRVLHEGGLYKMWYDGAAAPATGPGKGRHVGFATSQDGVRWEKYPGNPVLANAGGGDVKRIGGHYVLVYESFAGTEWALGASETRFERRGLLLSSSGERYDRFGHVTPNLVVSGDRLVALYFAGAEGKDGDLPAARNRNRIAVAFLQKAVVVRTPQGQRIVADVRALDADRVEVRLPEGYGDTPVVFEILAEDGATLLGSAPIVLKPGLYLRFDGSRLEPL